MHNLKSILVNTILLLACATLCVTGWLLWKTVGLVQHTEALLDTYATVPVELEDQINAISESLLDDLEPRVDRALEIVDKRSGQALHEIQAARVNSHADVQALQATVSAGLDTANKSVASLADTAAWAVPVLESTRKTLDSVRTTNDDLRPQLLGLTAAAKVTAGETAQTMKTIRDATPYIAASTVSGEEDLAAIVKDVRTIADKYVKPKTKTQRVLSFLELTAATVVAHLL